MTDISLQSYGELIQATIQQGRYAEAVAHGKQILKFHPKHVSTYRLMAEAMLEAGQDEQAEDLFRRVLSADPEDMVAWVGISEVHSRRGELDGTIYCLERAFELDPNNRILDEQLRHLYGRRDGLTPERVGLTRAALARLYLRGDLLSRAIAALRTLVEECPDRVDLRVALAEAYWRDEQRLEAADACQKVLNDLPFCLKANLILADIWTRSGRDEVQFYVRRAEALDPTGEVAKGLLGSNSVLPERSVVVPILDYGALVDAELPEWVADLEAAEAARLPETDLELADTGAPLQAEIELPAWLQKMSLAEESGEMLAELDQASAVQESLEAISETSASPVSEDVEVESEPEGLPLGDEEQELIELEELTLDARTAEVEGDGEVVGWAELAEIAESEEAEAVPEGAPDWLIGMASDEETSEAEGASEAAGWAELAEVTEGEEAEAVSEGAPDWLIGMASDEETAEAEGDSEAVGWAELAEVTEGEEAEAVPEEAPDWLVGITPDVQRAEAEGDSEAVGWAELAEVTEGEEAEGVSEEAPDWLTEILAGGRATEVEREAEEQDWASITEDESQLPVRPTSEVEQQADTEIPDWLLSESEEPAETVEISDWVEETEDQLRGERSVRSDDEAPSSPDSVAVRDREELETKAEDLAPARAISTGVPDWLAGLAPEVFGGEEAEPPEPPVSAELPEWLAILHAQADEEAELPDEVPPTKMPSWLEDAEGVPSGDDALAWLESLAAGKEDELAERAAAEGEARMAGIMGRPAEVSDGLSREPEVPVDETAVEAGGAPESVVAGVPETGLPEWLMEDRVPSGDEALAWLESLAAGREEELQARAVAEGEARMAAIMGRPTAEVSEAETEDVTAVDQGASVEAEPEGESPATVEAALVEESEETPVVEEVEAWGWTAIGVDEGVAAVDDGVPLGTEAQRDVKAAAPEAPGVEGPEPVAADEVKSLAGESVPVKAEISGEAEVTAPEAEAAGGEPGTVPVETLAAAEATGPAIERAAPIEVEASEAVEATAAEIEASEEYAAAPLQAVSLVSETVPAIEEDEPVEAKAPEEVEAAAPEAEAPEEPEAEPVETLAMAEAASIEAEVSEEGEAAALEAGAPEEPEAVLLEAPAVAETTTLAIEEAASVEVGAPEEVEVVTAITSEGEEPVVGPADAPLEAMPLEPEEEVVEVEQLEPAELEVPVRAAEALAAAMTDAPEPPAAAIESLRRAVDRDRRDYPSWLELGRRLWDAGDQPQSMRAYSRLIRAGKLLDIVIPDLEQRVAERPGVEVQQMLGDAYMKDGRLKEALQTYRRALNDL